ncbi:PIG-L deacetylase family protein [Nocardioides sp. GXZ039]|uniref:PIG-L deacetylase family protein n=1 Tax=Nocardioides sp. GXZ039 TaxID=3136018 RepID=UPI0030F3BAE5
MSGRFTIVSFHAHPDDEALLTAGTLARAAAEGHRVVLVVATNGEAGLSAELSDGADLGRRRLAELERSAQAIGAARVVVLGHPDSGWTDDPPDGSFCSLDPQAVAAELSEVLEEEQADVLTTYDPAGGYGHPDHIQVHRVAQLAARAAGTPVVLEATADRESVVRATSLLRRLSAVLPTPYLPDLGQAFTPRAEITHRVDVRAHLQAKLRALRAHGSQTGGGEGVRTIAMLIRLPRPLRRRVLGTEWFREVGRTPGAEPLDDVFATLRSGARP